MFDGKEFCERNTICLPSSENNREGKNGDRKKKNRQKTYKISEKDTA
jgi:hypothetical protein